MEILTDFEPWWRFAAALIIGALIGLEREFVQQRSGEHDFAGIRTFSLLAILGALSAYLSQQYGILVFVASFLGLVLLIWASYLGDVLRGHEEGITTEVVGLIVPLLGAMVIWGRVEVAAALGVVSAFLLALKPTLHGLARRMSAIDLRATLEFALITAVVLPLLPNRSFGPFDVINPFEIWLLVVFVSGIGFLGYILIKLLGTEQGIGLTGLLGGLVSSTATTVSFAGRSKENPGLASILARGILISSCVMIPRVLAEAAVVHAPLLKILAWPLGLMLLTGLGLVIFLWRKSRATEGENREEIKVSNPLRITAAIAFAVAFLVVLIAVRAANEFFGDTGVYIASAITGIVDVDAITLSAAELASLGQVEPNVAGLAVLLATIVNTGAKAVMASVLGGRPLRRVIAVSFGIILGVGLISTIVLYRVGL